MDFSRRNFMMASLAALGGCKLADGHDAAGRAYQADFAYGPAKGKLLLKVKGLRESVRLCVLGDSHLGLHDERDDAYAEHYKRMAQVPGDPQKFSETLALAKKSKADLVMLLGDIISFPTYKNIEFVRGELERSGVDWMYVAGNHDWHFEGVPGTDIEQRREWLPARLGTFYPKGADPLGYSRVVKGVRIVAIDDSVYHILPEQLAFWEREIATGDPTILMTHAPIWTEGWNYWTCGCPDWGAKIDPCWKIERRERWAERQCAESFAFRDSVLRAPNLIAAFSGHIHALMMARGAVNQFSVPSARKGDHFDVTIVPA